MCNFKETNYQINMRTKKSGNNPSLLEAFALQNIKVGKTIKVLESKGYLQGEIYEISQKTFGRLGIAHFFTAFVFWREEEEDENIIKLYMDDEWKHAIFIFMLAERYQQIFLEYFDSMPLKVSKVSLDMQLKNQERQGFQKSSPCCINCFHSSYYNKLSKEYGLYCRLGFFEVDGADCCKEHIFESKLQQHDLIKEIALNE